MTQSNPMKVDTAYIRESLTTLENTLYSFSIRAKVCAVESFGAEIEYKLRIEAGTKINQIKSLEPDIALAMSSPTGHVKIVAPLPGSDMISVTVPVPEFSRSKKKKAYEIITITKTIKVSQYSMAELLRDGTTSLFNFIGKYSYILAERINQIGRKSEEDTK